jgi:hypothetical protein
MLGGSFVTTGHTSGSAGVTACAAADCAPKLPTPVAVNAPPRNVRRFIMSTSPHRGLLIAVPLAAAIGVLMRFALQQYYASPLYAAANASAAPLRDVGA